MDKCAGYANTDGSYRYLVAPACLLNQLGAQKEKSTVSVGDTVDILGNSLLYNGSIIGTAFGATTASLAHRWAGPWMGFRSMALWALAVSL